MEERIKNLLKATNNVINVVQETSYIFSEYTVFDDLTPMINVIKEYRIVEDIDSFTEKVNRLPKSYITNVSYVINEILFNVIFGNMRFSYHHDRHFNDFMYLVISSRLLFSYTNVYFDIEKSEMESSSDLKKTYNRLVLLNKI